MKTKDLMLEKDQKAFIKKNVKRLKTWKKILYIYPNKGKDTDTVTLFAHEEAEKLYGPREKDKDKRRKKDEENKKRLK